MDQEVGFEDVNWINQDQYVFQWWELKKTEIAISAVQKGPENLSTEQLSAFEQLRCTME